jgi:glycosyltransferase involved in cell wall biosynthesis
MPRNKINLLYVGRLSKEKNIDAFLALSEIFDCRLWVVGDGPDRARLEQLGDATFVGFKTGVELAKYYASADVFVFPSKTDTLGIVSIEAMACGTPVAAYNVEGPRDVVVEGMGGALDDDLSKAVERAFKLKGRKSVLENAAKYSWLKAADTFINNLTPIGDTK